MLSVETIHKIRQAYHREEKSIRQIAREYHVSRNTVKKVIRSDATEFRYEREKAPALPKLGPYEEELSARLKADEAKPRREQRTVQILYEELQREGYMGTYDNVRRHVRKWRIERGVSKGKVYIPQRFGSGEAFQFDWSQELVEIGGMEVQLRVAHFRLCYSRMSFCVGYLREGLEMVLDAHTRAFEFFGGVCQKGIYDNPRTVVSKILQGRQRNFNLRFLSLCSHYLFNPVACTPAAGWEKGQVEHQVKFMRQHLFVPRIKFGSLEELNQWLSDRCRTLAAGRKHPEFKDRSIADCFAEEQASLMAVIRPFEGYREVVVRASNTALVPYDRNRYSVHTSAAGRVVMIRGYADRIVILYNGEEVGNHRRNFGRDQVIYDAWHYVDVLKQKPGALRNGAPFQDWVLPEPLAEARSILSQRPDGDRQFVDILGVISIYGLDSVVEACAEAIASGAVSRAVVLNILSHKHDDPEIPKGGILVHLPALKSEPIADCDRYDELLKGGVNVAR